MLDGERDYKEMIEPLQTSNPSSPKAAGCRKTFGPGWWGVGNRAIQSIYKNPRSTLLLHYQYPIWNQSAPYIELFDSDSILANSPDVSLISFKSLGAIFKDDDTKPAVEGVGLCQASFDRVDPQGDYDQDGVKNSSDACHTPNDMGPVDAKGCTTDQAPDGDPHSFTGPWRLGLTFLSETDLTVTAIDRSYKKGTSIQIKVGDRLTKLENRPVATLEDVRYLTQLWDHVPRDQYSGWKLSFMRGNQVVVDSHVRPFRTPDQ